jgi:hypothetical protein
MHLLYYTIFIMPRAPHPSPRFNAKRVFDATRVRTSMHLWHYGTMFNSQMRSTRQPVYSTKHHAKTLQRAHQQAHVPKQLHHAVSAYRTALENGTPFGIKSRAFSTRPDYDQVSDLCAAVADARPPFPFRAHSHLLFGTSSNTTADG